MPVARPLAGGLWVMPILAVEGGLGQLVLGVCPLQIQKLEDHTTVYTFNLKVTIGNRLSASA